MPRYFIYRIYFFLCLLYRFRPPPSPPWSRRG